MESTAGAVEKEEDKMICPMMSRFDQEFECRKEECALWCKKVESKDYITPAHCGLIAVNSNVVSFEKEEK